MRLLIKLKAAKQFAYDLRYHHKLQGVIYKTIKETEYASLHDKKGYKFFCFSNIFPLSRDMIIREGEVKNILISSPDKFFIKMLRNKLDSQKIVNIGEMQFEIQDISQLGVNLNKNTALISATPIIIRIPRKRLTARRIFDTFWYIN
jgi:CRISPR-associated endoribonuclease Cas6